MAGQVNSSHCLPMKHFLENCMAGRFQWTSKMFIINDIQNWNIGKVEIPYVPSGGAGAVDSLHCGAYMEAGGGRRAFTPGVTGRDGSYPAELLLEKGHEVYGPAGRSSVGKFDRIPSSSNVAVGAQAAEI